MHNFKIGKHSVGFDQPLYFVADIAANHDGELERAYKLIELAKEAGVPLRDINSSDGAKLPEDLESIAETILDQVTSGSDSPLLSTGQRALIRQRYTHYSANYNPLRTMMKGLVATFRLGRHFSPNAPADSGKRTIHPNN